MSKLKMLAMILALYTMNIVPSFGDALNCVYYSPYRGDNCSSTNSLRVEVTNQCGAPQKVWICLEKRSGDWACGLESALDSGASSSNFVCDAYGYGDIDIRYCDVESNCPSPH